MFLSVATRPDISFAVSYLSQFNNCFGKAHWLAAKRVLRYLKGTRNMALVFKKTGNPIAGFADADWASCTVDRKSYSGYCFMFGNSVVSWSSKKQTTIALSTAEAEYAAIAEATKEAIHLKKFANDLGLNQNKITISNDNQAAQHIATNAVISSKSKHVDIKIHFIRDILERGDIELKYLGTEHMTADILTKALPKPRHEEHVKTMGLVCESS
ncbi:Hydra magnipapillata [Nesidiocoris tenuis]|nr:Hydra magnipapillata [Nesidiocoris tenuis]